MKGAHDTSHDERRGTGLALIPGDPPRRRRARILLVTTLLLSGCIGVWHTPYRAGGPTPATDASPPPLDVFAYERRELEPRRTPRIDVSRHYDKILLEFPPVDGAGKPPVRLSANYYVSRRAGARSLVVVLPIWGSHPYPSRKMARTLRRRSGGDLHVVEVLGREPLFYWDEMREAPTEDAFIELSEQMTGRVMDMVVAIRQLVDWAERQEEIDGDRIGIVGFSMGAIVAAIALGVDERFAGGALMMGAAKPGEVFATCNGDPGRVRKTVLERFGWSRERYQALFEELFAPGDPRRWSARYDPSRLLIIDGAFDGCMSRSARRALWEATGRPERLRFFTRHKWAFLALTPFTLNIAGKKIHSFMDETLDPPREQLACATAASC